MTTVGTELDVILGRPVGSCVGRVVGVPDGLSELGRSELTTVGMELIAILGKSDGDCVG